MAKFAVPLNEDFKAMCCTLAGVDQDNVSMVINGLAYMTFEMIGPAEFNMKFLTEEEIFEAAKNDPTLEIVSL